MCNIFCCFQEILSDGYAYTFKEILFLMFYLKFITPKMWKLSWFSTFLLDYRGRTVCFFYVLEIFSANPWFWIYFLSFRMTGFTTFCTPFAENSTKMINLIFEPFPKDLPWNWHLPVVVVAYKQQRRATHWSFSQFPVSQYNHKVPCPVHLDCRKSGFKKSKKHLSVGHFHF